MAILHMSHFGRSYNIEIRRYDDSKLLFGIFVVVCTTTREARRGNLAVFLSSKLGARVLRFCFVFAGSHRLQYLGTQFSRPVEFCAPQPTVSGPIVRATK